MLETKIDGNHWFVPECQSMDKGKADLKGRILLFTLITPHMKCIICHQFSLHFYHPLTIPNADGS